MLDRLAGWLFDPSGLTPHGFCLLWEPTLIWLFAISDAVIGVAYFTIPAALIVFIRQRPDIALKPVFVLFAAFILLCGTDHWLNLLTLWVPAYRVEGFVKATTAAVSILTAISLWVLMPKALALPSPAQLGKVSASLAEREQQRLILADKIAAEQKQASQYTRSLIEASLDPLVTISPEGKITDANEATIKITGVPRDDLIGTDFSDYFTESDRAREGYQQVFAKGFVTDYPLTSRRKDGHLTDVLYNASVYKDENGKVLGVFAAARDVTVQKQVERELAEQRSRELEKLAELERFQRVTIDRELKMIELKKEVAELNKGRRR